MDFFSSIYFLIILLFLYGFFSGAETALTSLSIGKVHALEEKNKSCSKFIRKLKEHPEKMLITILIGNTVVNVWASVLASELAHNYFGNQTMGYVIGIMTFIILIFGEIVPKTFAQRFNVLLSQVTSPILYIFQIIIYPIILVLEVLTKFFIKLMGEEKIASVTEDEVIAMLNIGHQEGEFNKQENEFIRNIFEFSDTTAEEIMANRNEIEALPCDCLIKEAVKAVKIGTYSRIPIYKESIDDIIGYVTVKDILKLPRNKENLSKKLIDLEYKEILYFPITTTINGIFKSFQKQRIHIAIILDEFGSTAGLVTLEDILEEIVGEIVDETDHEEENIKKLSKKSYSLKGTTTLAEICECHWIETDIAPHRSLAFLILKTLGKFPNEGDKIKLPESRSEFIVETMTGKTIQQVRMNVRD